MSSFAVSLCRAVKYIFWLLDRVLGPRSLKMAEDGPKMATRWPQAGPKMAQDGSQGGLGGGFHSMTSYKNEQLTTNACQYNADIGFKPL